MNIFVIFCAILGLSFAEIATLNNKYEQHYTQHETSVNAARQSLQEKLAKLHGEPGMSQSQYGYSGAGSSGSQRYVAGCSTCTGTGTGSGTASSFSSRSSSSSTRHSGHEIEGSDYVGVGVVGHSNDVRFSSDDDDDVQINVAPSYSGDASSQRFSSNAYDSEDMQQKQIPVDLSTAGSSAYRASALSQNEEDLQRNVGPNYQPAYGGTVSRLYSSQRRKEGASESSRTASSVIPVYVPVGSESSQRSSSSLSESELQESRTFRPIQPGQYVNIAAKPHSSTVLNVPVRVQYVPSSEQMQQQSRSEFQSGSESNVLRGQPGHRVTYYPASTYTSSADKSSSRSEQEIDQSGGLPEKFTSYGSYRAPETLSQTRFSSEGTQSQLDQTRVAPAAVTYPIEGGSSRVASSGASSSQRGYTHSRVVPVYPVSTIESSSASSRTEEEREQRRLTQARPTYIYSGRNVGSEHEDSRGQLSSTNIRPTYVLSGRTSTGSDRESSSQYGSSGATTYFVAPSASNTRTQTQYQSGTGSQTQYQSGSGAQSQYQRQGYTGSNQQFSPYVPAGRASTFTANTQATGSSSADRLSTRFGTGVMQSGTDDLNTYMTEAERLARLQQQQIASSSGSSNVAVTNSEANRRTLQNAANLDSAAAQFVSSSNVANRNSELDTLSVDSGAAVGPGGYKRVKSWQKQSKWASGAQYGTDGQPKSYSMLSTAESEKHNIDGQETGFKAATSTLENDGKVSTYSIHTP